MLVESQEWNKRFFLYRSFRKEQVSEEVVEKGVLEKTRVF